jgi:membrane-associated protein
MMFSPANLLNGAGVLFGLLIIGGIIFSESGMLVGFFMPGDTLLLTAGAFAAQGKLPIIQVIIVVAIAAILGDNVGYEIGKRYGRNLFKKQDGLLFRREYLERAEKFYEKYGSKTMLLAHFVPIVRTFAPVVAGIGRMNRMQFFVYDAIGDIAWAIIVTMLGYLIGNKIPNIDHYFLFAVLIASIFTFSPLIWHLAKDKEFHAKLRSRFGGNKKEPGHSEKND